MTWVSCELIELFRDLDVNNSKSHLKQTVVSSHLALVLRWHNRDEKYGLWEGECYVNHQKIPFLLLTMDIELFQTHSK